MIPFAREVQPFQMPETGAGKEFRSRLRRNSQNKRRNRAIALASGGIRRITNSGTNHKCQRVAHVRGAVHFHI